MAYGIWSATDSLLFLLIPFPLYAAPFTPGNLVVYRVGSGTGNLVNTGNPVYLDEYTPSGTLVQSIGLPTTANGTQKQLIASGTATAEGILTRSPDGRYLLLAGYASNIPGDSSLPSSAGTTVPRVIALVNADGTIDTSTALTDFASGNTPRSAVTVDGTTLWVAGGTGLSVATLGSTTFTVLAGLNSRQVNIFADQLYLSSGSSTNTNRGVNTVGSGLPTTGTQTPTRLPGLTDTTNPSTYGFFFADLDAGVTGLDTLYVADDGAGALRKFSLVSGSWSANGVVGVDADDYRGLTGVVSGSTVTLYATRKGGSGATGGGELVTLTDNSGYNGTLSGTPTLLASAGSSTAFRGVALAPLAVDIPPRVSSTTPAANATNVVTNSTLILNFNETVDLTANAATLECPSGTAVTLTGLPASDVTSVTLTPSSALPNNTVCTVTVVASEVTDHDGTGDPLDGDKNGTGGDNYSFTFTTGRHCPAPQPPTISSLAPADNATDVAISSNLVITFSESVQHYFVGRYGQISLAAGQRLYQPTNQFLPGSAGALNLAADNAKRLLILDDGQDINSLGDNPNPAPYLGSPPPAVIRGGDQVTNLIGVLDFGRINSDTTPARDYRLHPTTAPLFTAQNARTSSPDAVGGTLKVAALKVLNYFNGNGAGGGFPTSRGADTASEFDRQRTKIITALVAMNADVVGLIEIENDGYGNISALQDLVNGLNAAMGSGLSSSDEDLQALWIDHAQSQLYFATHGDYSLPGGLKGNEDDIILCTYTSLGTNTACTFTRFWNGDRDHNFDDDAIDGLTLGPPPTLVAASSIIDGIVAMDDTLEYPGDDVDEANELDGEEVADTGDEVEVQNNRIFLPVVTR